MNNRQQFLDYVQHGGRPICSPQIGGGAGFDAKLAGKRWLSQVTLEDTLAAIARFEIVPLINIGLCDLGVCTPVLAWQEVSRIETETAITVERLLPTPHGTLTSTYIEQPISGGTCVKYPVTGQDDLGALEYYLDAALDADLSPIAAFSREQVTTIAGRAPLSVQWAVQPYEMFGLPNTVDTAMLAYECPEVFYRLMDKILLLDDRIMAEVRTGGADFIFLGGPGAEMASPKIYHDYLIPYSQQASAMAHDHGLLVYSHICSPVEPFLTMGCYNQMGIDLFETLSPPPVGNVQSLADALDKLDPDICTRGNLGLDLLLEGTVETIREQTLEIMAATANRKHLVAASDYLFYNIPEENVRVMADTVRQASR